MLAATTQDGGNVTYGVTVLVAWLLVALIPALIADRKGYRFATWYIFGLLLWIVALICALLLTSKGKLNEHMRYDAYYNCWVTYDDAGRWYWHDGAGWQPFR